MKKIRGLLRNPSSLQIRGGTGDDETRRSSEPEVDHVAIDGFDEPHPRVEALADHVHEAVLYSDVDYNLRMAGDERREDRREDEGNGCAGNREFHATGHFAWVRGDRLQGLERLVHARSRVLKQAPTGVRECNIARGSREQSHADAFLELPY
jgi:hypothetical protein